MIYKKFVVKNNKLIVYFFLNDIKVYLQFFKFLNSYVDIKLLESFLK